MKVLKLAGVGLVIWGLSLWWPEANQVFTPLVMIGLALGLGAGTLAYVLIRRLYDHQDGDIAGQDHPTLPIPVVLTR